MDAMWKSLLTQASDAMPDFNDYLLTKFRKEKISNIKVYLDTLFRESVKRFDGRLQYHGYTVLTPDEQLQYIRQNKILKKKEQRAANAEPIVVQFTVDPDQLKKLIKEAVMEAFEDL